MPSPRRRSASDPARPHGLLIPARRSSSAAAHTFCWQLSASSWIRTRLRLPGAGGSDLAASRSAVVSGPRPRGFIFSRASPKRCTSSGSRGRSSSTSPQSPRRWPKATRPTRVCGPTLASARRTASRARTTLLTLTPSILPAMEPEPSRTTITEAGSWACAAVVAASPRSAAHAKTSPRPRPRWSLHMADATRPRLQPGTSHCTRGRVGLARALLGKPPDGQT